MKKFFLFIVLVAFPLLAMAQASGGQISRPTKRQSSQPTRSIVTQSRNTTRTYTVKEQYEMGSSYYDKGNYQEAIKWYTKAAENGYPDAQSELGFMYLGKRGTLWHNMLLDIYIKMGMGFIKVNLKLTNGSNWQPQDFINYRKI